MPRRTDTVALRRSRSSSATSSGRTVPSAARWRPRAARTQATSVASVVRPEPPLREKKVMRRGAPTKTGGGAASSCAVPDAGTTTVGGAALATPGRVSGRCRTAEAALASTASSPVAAGGGGPPGGASSCDVGSAACSSITTTSGASRDVSTTSGCGGGGSAAAVFSSKRSHCAHTGSPSSTGAIGSGSATAVTPGSGSAGSRAGAASSATDRTVPPPDCGDSTKRNPNAAHVSTGRPAYRAHPSTALDIAMATATHTRSAKGNGACITAYADSAPAATVTSRGASRPSAMVSGLSKPSVKCTGPTSAEVSPPDGKAGTLKRNPDLSPQRIPRHHRGRGNRPRPSPVHPFVYLLQR